jgi:hypothetical protein
MPKLAASVLVLFAVGPALAHHRQTPPVVQFTTSGDNALPRLASFSAAFALVIPSTGDEGPIVGFTFPYPSMRTVATGSDANPAVSLGGRVTAWDADVLGNGNRQVYMRSGSGGPVLISNDTTGTSSNPSVSGSGRRIAFESNGNLAGTNNQGSRHIFVWTKFGMTQASRGLGTSLNPALNRGGLLVAFQSTSDPSSGLDTGKPQVWFTDLKTGVAKRVTSGPGPSYNPVISADGRLIGFESRADLAGDGHDTGKSQIFLYDIPTGNFAQVTNESAGCWSPSIHRFREDWRIGFVCGGQAYYYLLRAAQRFQVPINAGGDVAQVTAELNPEFLMISTTSVMNGSGLTTGHQVYLVNLYKRPAVPVPGTAVWFPAQGIPPL